MSDKVLVTYASKHGATAEIGAKIAGILKQEGLDVDVMPVKKVGDVSSYRAVVLGSAAYIGQWRKEAVMLLATQEKQLSEMPTWLFYSGPAGEGDPVELLNGRIFPDKLKPVIDRIKPKDTAVFGGDVRPEKFGFFEKRIIRMVKSAEGDFRDWDAITGWAKGIAVELKQEEK